MAKSSKGMKIGILTAGGDCPGLNAAIRGVGKAAILDYGMEVIGFSSGYQGLITNETVELKERNLSGIMTMGGTILGTSREKPYKNKDSAEYAMNKAEQCVKNYEKLGLDCLVCIGGNGTVKTAYKLAQEGLNIIALPKTIDNDVWGTDVTFGFDSALGICTEAIDRLHTTANSHKRIMVIEVMGHHTGWLALYAGLAGSGDLILIPEIEYDFDVIANYLNNRAKLGKPYSIVVVAEGVMRKNQKKKKKDESNKHKSICYYLGEKITELTGLETRETVLGYIQRGGSPSPMDRILATRFGTHAAKLISERTFGRMVALENNKIISAPLADVAGKLKYVPADDPIISQAKSLDTCFGDEI